MSDATTIENRQIDGKRLVIDTCVCRSSGGLSEEDGFSVECSELLQCIYDYNFYFVCTIEVNAEFMDDFDNNMFSYFVHSWFRNMMSRGRIYSLDQSTLNNGLRWQIETIPMERKAIDDILKDIHLIEAANATDNKVISCDRRAYKHFQMLSVSIDEIKPVLWVDLNTPDNHVIEWLQNGAQYDISDTLGSKSPPS